MIPGDRHLSDMRHGSAWHWTAASVRSSKVAPALGTTGLSEACRPRSPSGAANRNRGFTLLEMVAVLALIGIIAVAMTFSLVRGLTSTKVMAASRDVAAAMRYTRGQAILKREERILEVDTESNSYTAPGRATVKLPDDMRVTVLTTRDLTNESETVGRIRFFPDGSSTGGWVRLNSGAREWLVNVAWLTGEISLEEVRE